MIKRIAGAAVLLAAFGGLAALAVLANQIVEAILGTAIGLVLGAMIAWGTDLLATRRR